MSRVVTSAHRFCRQHLKSVLLPASALLLLTASGAAQTPPAAPTNLAATVTTGPQVQLSWTDNSSTEHYFFIYRATSSSGPYEWWDVAYANSTSYTDSTSLVTAPVYYYKVSAFDELNGLESTLTNSAEAVLPVGVPRAPSAFECNAYGTTVYVTWEDASWNEDDFVISYSWTGSDGTYSDIGTASENSGCYVHYGAIPNATLYYKVRARNSYGSSECVGPFEVLTGDWEY